MIFLENQLKICFYNKFIDVFLPLFTEGNNNKWPFLKETISED